MSRAVLIAVGSELLQLGRIDTNTPWIAERLRRVGIETVARMSLADDEMAIADAIRLGAERASWIVLTGGLGPTIDDRTRHALAAVAGEPLERDPEMIAKLERRFAQLGMPLGEQQRTQADRPTSFSWLDNPNGSAAGLRGRLGETTVVALPGVPSEMKPMFERLEGLGSDAPSQALHRLRVAGRGEGELDESLSDLWRQYAVEPIVLCGGEGIEIHLPQPSNELLDALRQRLGDDLYTEASETLADCVARRLSARGETVAVAESCTGGLLGGALSAIPGSSAWFLGGVTSYSNEIKVASLGVDADVIEREGAVSEPVARAMAAGVRQRMGADWGVGITGIAGPGGGSEEKPVGLVHVAMEGPEGAFHWRTMRTGDRENVRRRTVAFALDRLRRGR